MSLKEYCSILVYILLAEYVYFIVHLSQDSFSTLSWLYNDSFFCSWTLSTHYNKLENNYVSVLITNIYRIAYIIIKQ